MVWIQVLRARSRTQRGMVASCKECRALGSVVRSAGMRRDRLLGLSITLLCVGVGVWWVARGNDAGRAGRRSGTAASAASAPAPLPAHEALEQLAPGSTEVVALDARAARVVSATQANLGWGRCPTCLGKPEQGEGQGETPLRLAVDADGGALLLDGENKRALRLGPDGKPAGTIPLPFAPRDLTTSKSGELYLLGANERNVTVLDARGRARATLPIPESVANSSRRVVVQGDDVYVESLRGEYTLVGSTQGTAVEHPDVVAGIPMRDGRGWLSVRIVEGQPGGVHVLVVERPSEAQRFSRLVQPSLVVEGIFLVDTSLDGTIYVGLTGNAPGSTLTEGQLLCLDGAHGQVLGLSTVPVAFDTEVVLDGKALDAGGVVFSVQTSTGVRVERLDCHGV